MRERTLKRLAKAGALSFCGVAVAAGCGSSSGSDPDPDPPDLPAPTTPALVSPMPDVHIGRHTLLGSLRTTFTWSAAQVTGDHEITYQLELSRDASFAAGVTTISTRDTSHLLSTDLEVSQTPPVGARYYWRVRACTSMTSCSEPTAARWINFGRAKRDYNGDGYSDVLAGAASNGTQVGRALIYFGGPGSSFNSAPDGQFNPLQPNDYLGVAVASAGDVNADGFSDVIIGATFGDGKVADSGAAYLYLGGAGATFDSSPDAVLPGEKNDDRFGKSVAGGDFNGDGYSDIVVSAHRNDDTGTDGGRAYVFYGGVGAFDTTPDGILSGVGGEFFGNSVAVAGDVNRDGYADLLIGAPQSDVGGTDVGRALLYYGGAGTAFDTTADQIFNNNFTTTPIGHFGFGLAGAGDINGDGLADLIIGAQGLPSSGQVGRAYLYLGSASGTFLAQPSATFSGQHSGDAFGRSVSPAGDVNGDGVDDLIIGAAQAAGSVGFAYLYYGARGAVDITADGTFSSGASLDLLGNSVSGGGDLNGDGFSDLVIGCHWYDPGVENAGRVQVYFGGSSFDTTPEGLLNGSLTQEAMGISVASLMMTCKRCPLQRVRRG